MAMGKPILIGVAGEAAELVTDAGAGVAVAPGDVEAMAAAMVRLAHTPAAELEAMGRRGLEYYRRRFSHTAALDATSRTIERAAT